MLRSIVVASILVIALPASAQTSTGDRERPGAPHRLILEGTIAGWRTYVPEYVSPGFPLTIEPAHWNDGAGGGAGAYARVRLADSRDETAVASDQVTTLADLDLGVRSFVYLSRGPDGTQAPFRLGNLYAGASGGARTRAWSVRGGGGIALPVASAFDHGGADSASSARSLYSLGAWDSWLAVSDVLPIVLRAEATYDIGPFFAGVELGGALMPFIPARYSEGPSFVAGQIAAWAGGRIEDLVALGLRGQAVALLEYDGPARMLGGRYEEGFVALVPFVRFELRRWTIEARGTINLDDPQGLFSDGSRNWSLRVHVGLALDE